MIYAVILFPSTHHAIRAEKKARENGFSVKLIPVPRHLSSDCGVCLRCPLEQREALETLLEQEGVRIEAVHPLP
ncbi:MAG: DUF3343 domain-containing protein [Desulfobacterota bacterium]|nr:DUF3343 domain-containing protein [Thermodesulfobacteriota bacterium]